MNSIMLISTPILRRTCWPPSVLALTFDAGTTRGADDRRVDCSGRQHHPVARVQLEPLSLLLEHECDRAVDAVQDLLVREAVRRIPNLPTLRPSVARTGFAHQARHQIVPGRRAPEST